MKYMYTRVHTCMPANTYSPSRAAPNQKTRYM